MNQMKGQARSRPELNADIEGDKEIVDRVKRNRRPQGTRASRQISTGEAQKRRPDYKEDSVRWAKPIKVMGSAKKNAWNAHPNPPLRPIGRKLLHQVTSIDYLFGERLDRNDWERDERKEKPTWNRSRQRDIGVTQKRRSETECNRENANALEAAFVILPASDQRTQHGFNAAFVNDKNEPVKQHQYDPKNRKTQKCSNWRIAGKWTLAKIGIEQRFRQRENKQENDLSPDQNPDGFSQARRHPSGGQEVSQMSGQIWSLQFGLACLLWALCALCP